ncbi:Clp protease N-terminal domain-containing protein [Melissospora conviva]|uniref:Clp protease N-terminal domain-containing protein n=1 Tax=Melissospora conviva TaxID=3388432 RepID=UPI003C243399
MFERFSREARGAVTGAQQVARDTATRTIDTRHILVALAEGASPAATALRTAGVDIHQFTATLRSELMSAAIDPEALAGLGIDLAAVRERTDATFGSGALDRVGHSPRHIPFTRDAKKALELALREAIRLRQKSIDGRHLLLGILDIECPGRDALTARDVDLHELRRALEDLNATGSQSA